jgi:hypothetical protein
MDIISRVKNILLTPKTEWQTIEAENESHMKVFTTYVALLALIPAIATFIGKGLIGYSVFGVRVGGSIGYGIGQAIVQYIIMVGGVYLTAFVINLLAENFNAKKDFDKSFSLVAFAYTPMFIGGIFNIIPAISILAGLIGLYSFYLLYIGLQPMMKQPEEKTVSYFVVSLIAMLVVYFVLLMILGAIATALFFGAAYRF